MASRVSIFSTKIISALAGTCTAILTWCSRSEHHSAKPRIHPRKWNQWCGSWWGPRAACVTENSWRPSLVAGERLSGPHQGSIEVLANFFLPRAGSRQ